MLLFGILGGEEPSLLMIWSIFLGFGIFGMLLSILRWWASIPILGILLLYALALFGDFYAPDLYPAIMHEDPNYITIAALAVVVGMALPVTGMFFNFARRVKRTE